MRERKRAIESTRVVSKNLTPAGKISYPSIMRKTRKHPALALLEKLRGQPGGDNNIASHDLQQQSSDSQFDEQLANNDIITPPFCDDNLNASSSSSANETHSQPKEEPLLVKIRDISTSEITTRKMQPNQVWNLEGNEKIIVELNGDGQGCDNGSNLLVRFLGKLSQNSTICPISVERWDRMPEANSRQQWQYIEEKFEFDYAAGIKWAMRTLGERWRAYKYKLRREHFYPNKSKKELLANPPSSVDCVDWTAFVHHYTEKKMKTQSLQNTRNRKKLKVSHAGGSKSNARRGCQMEQKLGRPVCRSEIILSTLQKKDGSYVNEEGKILAEKISEHLSQDQEHAATSGVPSKILAYPNDAIGKVYGDEHSGRVRGLGSVCPSTIFGTPKHTSQMNLVGISNNVSQQRVEDLEKHVETLEEKLTGYEETKEQLVETQEQLAQTQNQLATLHKFLQAKFGSELHTFDQDSS